MKKLISIFLTVCLMFCMASCAGVNEGEGPIETPKANEADFNWRGTKIWSLAEGKENLKTIVIPKKCTGFISDIFFENEFVEHIFFENDDFPIDVAMFSSARSLKTVQLPANMETIPRLCFFDCRSLETITIPDKVKVIEENAFNDCRSLTTVKMGQNVEIIEEGAFYDCPSLKKVEFPASLRKIGYRAFQYNDSLEEIKFHEGLEFIDSTAFQYCPSLKEVRIPEGVHTIGEFTFADCENLERVYLPSTLKEFTVRSFIQKKTITLYMKEGSLPDTTFEEYTTGKYIREYY